MILIIFYTQMQMFGSALSILIDNSNVLSLMSIKKVKKYFQYFSNYRVVYKCIIVIIIITSHAFVYIVPVVPALSAMLCKSFGMNRKKNNNKKIKINLKQFSCSIRNHHTSYIPVQLINEE